MLLHCPTTEVFSYLVSGRLFLKTDDLVKRWTLLLGLWFLRLGLLAEKHTQILYYDIVEVGKNNLR